MASVILDTDGTQDATTFAGALTALTSALGTSNLPSLPAAIHYIYVQTTTNVPLIDRLDANGFTCDATHNYHVVFRNQPDVREPLGSSGGSTFAYIRDDYVEVYGENGPQDLNIIPDLTNTTDRSLVQVGNPNSSIHDAMCLGYSGGSGNAYLGFLYHLSLGSIYNLILSGCNGPIYGAYRKGNSNAVSVYDCTIYKCSTFRADAFTTIQNMAVFDTPFYAAMNAASDYNATSNAAVTGSTGSNNLLNLVATDCFVDPENNDFNLKAGSPLIDAGLDFVDGVTPVNIGAIKTAPAAPLTIAPIATTLRTTEVTATVTNASATGLLVGAFSATLDGQALTISSFTEVGANEYTLGLTASDTLPVQYGTKDIAITENGVTATVSTTFNPAAGKSYASLASGFIYTPLFVIGQAVAAGEERFYNGEIFSHAAGISNPQVNPADGVDGWAYERPSTSVMDGADSAVLNEHVEFPTTRNYSVSNLGEFSYDDITTPLSVDVRTIKPDGTVTAYRTMDYQAANIAPTITGSAVLTVAENTPLVISYTITNLDGQTPTLAGADVAQFSALTNTSGDVWQTTLSAQDFENPADSNTDNVYNLQVVADDGVNTAVTFDTAVTVSDVVVPVLDFSSFGPFTENASGGTVYTNATDIELLITNATGDKIYFAANHTTETDGRLTTLPLPSQAIGASLFFQAKKLSTGVSFGRLPIPVTDGGA